MNFDKPPASRRALIVGHTGQDGRLLWQLLSSEGYVLAGRSSKLSEVSSNVDGPLPPGIDDKDGWLRWLESFRPNEIYYLPAFQTSSQGDHRLSTRELYEKSYRIHVLGAMNILDAIVAASPDSRFFYASSSLVYGVPVTSLLSETSRMFPTEIYGITKLNGSMVCQEYRRRNSVFTCTGILFNHESALRKSNFLSQKVIRTALDISQGRERELVLGDLSAEVDWGHAADFVRAFHAVLMLDHPNDYVIASGELHTVQEFVEIVFSSLGLNWEKYVSEDPTILTRRSPSKIGDISRITSATGWKPSMPFKDFVIRLVDETRKEIEA